MISIIIISTKWSVVLATIYFFSICIDTETNINMNNINLQNYEQIFMTNGYKSIRFI